MEAIDKLEIQEDKMYDVDSVRTFINKLIPEPIARRTVIYYIEKKQLKAHKDKRYNIGMEKLYVK
jgi:hypothetical protein